MSRWNVRMLADTVARRCMAALAVFCIFMVALIAFGLIFRARPLLADNSLWTILTSSDWRPLKGHFGLLPFIAGTLWVTAVAVILAVPISVMTAIYLSEYAPSRIRRLMGPVVDLLAGIPSVIYGVWGILLVVPLVRQFIAPWFGTYSSGYTILTAGIVLGVMIFPVIIHVCLEVFGAVPMELREASLSLGATRWQTVKHVVFKRALPGVLAANVLGLSRAFGETMAVLMVAGNVARMPVSVLDSGYPLPALIANNYGEMMSIPLYDSAIMFAALILFGVVLVFNVISRMVLIRLERNMGVS